MEFYDKQGRAYAYSPDGEYIYLWSGKPVAYFRDEKIYSFAGRFLGRFENGWIIDQSGRRSLFTTDASGGPVRPVRQVKPVKGVRQVRPIKGARQTTPVKPVTSLQWGDPVF